MRDLSAEARMIYYSGEQGAAINGPATPAREASRQQIASATFRHDNEASNVGEDRSQCVHHGSARCTPK